MKKLILTLSILAAGCTYNEGLVDKSDNFVKDGRFTQGVEGPAVDSQGRLYAVNFEKQGTVGRVNNTQDKTAEPETALTLKNGSIANGIRFDKQGNMYLADYVNHNVLKVSASAIKQHTDLSEHVTVFAHEPKMNQPNDLAIMDNGTLFASDPNWQKGTGNVWRINTDGSVDLLESDMGTTNGIEVSPDNKTLYVNESVQQKVWQYDLDAKGNISNKRLLISFDDFGLDGMRTDVNGNLYIARYGAGVISVVSPKGELLHSIALKGMHPTNVAFGGEDGKTVFVTMQKRGAIEKFRAQYKGRAYKL